MQLVQLPDGRMAVIQVTGGREGEDECGGVWERGGRYVKFVPEWNTRDCGSCYSIYLKLFSQVQIKSVGERGGRHVFAYSLGGRHAVIPRLSMGLTADSPHKQVNSGSGPSPDADALPCCWFPSLWL